VVNKTRTLLAVEPLESRLVPAWFLNMSSTPVEPHGSDYKDLIRIESWSFEIDPANKANSQNESSTRKAILRDIIVTRATDSASPLLFQKCVTGEHMQKVTLEYFKSDTDTKPYLQYKLKNAFISSYSLGGGDLPMETFTLNFNKLKLKYKVQTDTSDTDSEPPISGPDHWSPDSESQKVCVVGDQTPYLGKDGHRHIVHGDLISSENWNTAMSA
jgi:type VI secretion system secreted protein Hcp